MIKTSPRTRLRVHPGEILRHEFMEPLGLSARALAAALAIPANRVTEIANGERGVSADTAHRLAKYFGTSVEMWLNLQAAFDIAIAASKNDYSAIKRRTG